MRKRMSPIWFIKEPIDQEEKEYILLGYLKKLSKKLGEDKTKDIIRETSKLIFTLKTFKKEKKFDQAIIISLNRAEQEEALSFDYSSLTAQEKSDLDIIVENSLNTLYEYSGVFLDVLSEEEEKIRILTINKSRKGHDKSGILAIRNMVTDKMIGYLFQNGIKMKTDGGEKEVSILKKIPIENPFFSLSYEYLHNEILSSIKGGNKDDSFYVIEIYGDFDEDSEIHRRAKEKFINQIGISKKGGF